MESIWQKTVSMPSFEKLNQDLDVDIAIIGGGLAGILCAYLLRERGLNAVIFEANQIAGGQIAKTTAKITAQHGPIYAKMIENDGFFKAKQYYEAQMQALHTYKEIIAKEKIDCDFKPVQTYLFTRKHPEILEREAKAYQQLHLNGGLEEPSELPFAVTKALAMNHQAIFHPLKFLSHLAKKLTIYEHTPVMQVKGLTLTTLDCHRIQARKIIFACHYPFVNIPGYYFLKMHQNRSHVAAYSCSQPIQNAYLSIDADAISLRPYQNWLLIGGYPHRTGQAGVPSPIEKMNPLAKLFIHETKEPDAVWASQDCITLDGLPYIGQFSYKTPDWYVLTGFQKWGMTNAMTGALIIRDLIIFQKSAYGDVFDPLRFEPRKTAQPFFCQAGISFRHYLRHLKLPTCLEKDLKPDEAGIILRQCRKYGAYKDIHGKMHYCLLTCPHLGCELSWNMAEKTWDCPCHGSRFDIDGHLLDNPAIHRQKKT